MNKDLFMRTLFGVSEYDTYFMCKKNCTDFSGFSSIQKFMAAIRCLAYGAPANAAGEYPRMSGSTCFESVYNFCSAVVAVFRQDYLRAPNANETTRILA
jgi:hypothetical protein